jgi:glycosyltransferase involved in cell wall biosynthesis
MTSRSGSNAPRATRLLHVLWSGRIGGAERAVYQLVRQQISDPDLDVGVLFATREGAYHEAVRSLGCEIVTLELPNARAVRAIPRAAHAMSSFDIHHFHSAEPVLMLASLRCKGVRRFYTHRGGAFDYPLKQRLRYFATGRLVSRFDGLSANTAHAVTYASRLLRIDRGRFTVTYNGLDFDLLRPERPREIVRGDLGLSDADFVVGTAANLRRWKRIDALIRAVGSMQDAPIRLLIVGDGPDRRRLEALAGSGRQDRRIIFTGEQKRIADYLLAMDAFCLPSTAAESFGNAAVEAMALGLPTVVFADGGGLLEHIRPDRTGFVVANGNELVPVLRRLMADPGLRQVIGKQARDSVRKRYTLDRAAQAYRELYGLDPRPAISTVPLPSHA